MDNTRSNSAIQCTVASCTHHNKDKNYCSLNEIKVGLCGPANGDPACTECASFQLGRS